MDLAYIIVILALLGLFVWREYCHDRERRDLYSRLMARDLSDYIETTKQDRTPPSPSRNFVAAGLRRSAEQRARELQEAGD